MTIRNIKGDFVFQHDMLHESIHAIFRRTPEECEGFKIQDGTGIQEYYNDGSHIGRGLNEGLTEWLCKKAGYPLNVYEAESNIVELFELAIGEERVMQLTKGDINGNVAELLQMPKKDLVKMLYDIDEIWKKEDNNCQLDRIIGVLSNRKNQILSNENQEQLKEELGVDYDKYAQMMKNMGYFLKNININDVNEQISYLQGALSFGETDLTFNLAFLKENIYLKYFNMEIEDLQNGATVSKETMNRLTGLYNNITQEQASHSPILSKFKNEIYPNLQSKSPVVNESKFAEIYEKAKGSISQVLGEIKTFFKGKTNNKDKNDNELDEH